jgi:hypothetical protein
VWTSQALLRFPDRLHLKQEKLNVHKSQFRFAQTPNKVFIAQHKNTTMVKDMSYNTISKVIESWEAARNSPQFEEKVGTLALLK